MTGMGRQVCHHERDLNYKTHRSCMRINFMDISKHARLCLRGKDQMIFAIQSNGLRDDNTGYRENKSNNNHRIWRKRRIIR